LIGGYDLPLLLRRKIFMREYQVVIQEVYERTRQLRIKAGNEKLLEEHLNGMIEGQRRRLGMDEAEVASLEILSES
tara:strand:- start:605 stop:832 length:228 start_codon:yes stop_codon:yes gene_type:complete